MRRAILAIAVTAVAATALPQLSLAQGSDRNAPKTGRTDEGLKIDAEIDQLYRARAGQKTPDVRADPWSDVRTPATQPAPKATTAKPKQ